MAQKASSAPPQRSGKPSETNPHKTTRPYSDQTRERMTRNSEEAAKSGSGKSRPQHHLAGLYLDEFFGKLLQEVGNSDSPFETMMNHIVDLPVDIQRDMLCGCIREMRKLVKATAIREIAENASPDKTQPPRKS